LMHHRRSGGRGWLVCAAVSLLFLLPTVTLAAEGGSEHGGGGLINLDKSLIVQVINFVILLINFKKVPTKAAAGQDGRAHQRHQAVARRGPGGQGGGRAPAGGERGP